MSKTELKLRIDTLPGLAELKSLVANLKRVIADALPLPLQMLNNLFAGSDDSFKPGFVELIEVSAIGAGGPSVIKLHATDRFRKFVAATVANEFQLLIID